MCMKSEDLKDTVWKSLIVKNICSTPLHRRGDLVTVARARVIVCHCKVGLLKYSVNLVKC